MLRKNSKLCNAYREVKKKLDKDITSEWILKNKKKFSQHIQNLKNINHANQPKSNQFFSASACEINKKKQ